MANLDHKRFGAVLGMLRSDIEDSMKLVALGRANAMLTAAGKSWSDVADAMAAAPARSEGIGFNPASSDAFAEAFADIFAGAWGYRQPDRRQERPQPSPSDEFRGPSGFGREEEYRARSDPSRPSHRKINYVSGLQIPRVISGMVKIVDRRDVASGEILIIHVVDEHFNEFGPMVVLDRDLVTQMNSKPLQKRSGIVRQPNKPIDLPVFAERG